MCNFFIRLFCPKLYRPKYYRYFDSWELKELPPLPALYQPYCPAEVSETKGLFCCVRSLCDYLKQLQRPPLLPETLCTKQNETKTNSALLSVTTELKYH